MLYLRIAMRTNIWLFAAVTLLVTSVHADERLDGLPSGSYPLDLTHASVVWKVNHLGFSTYVGRFTDFSATITLDSDDFTNSNVAVDIKTDSIDTAYPLADQEDFNNTLAVDWLKSDEHPSITFNSSTVGQLQGGKTVVTGDLSMAGQTHPINLNITLNNAAASHPFSKVAALGFSATAEIDRTQWGVAQFAGAVGTNVRIEIEGEFLMAK